MDLPSTEFANDGILVIQGGKTVFANPACSAFLGRPVIGSAAQDFFDDLLPEERPRLRHYLRWAAAGFTFA
ncbi:MAG: PAS domain-containing protein [Deltaproteobacteria bacterium]|nr:PAS domain-containing protein [Deltaproteobacteria bacterium]